MQRSHSNTYLFPEKCKSRSTLPSYKFQEASPSCQALVQPNESNHVISYSSSQHCTKDNLMNTTENHSFTTKKEVNVESLVGMFQTQKFRELDAQMPLDRGIQIDGDVEKYQSLLQDSDTSCDTTASSCHTFKEAQKRCRDLKYRLMKKHEQLRQLQAEFRSLCQSTQKSQQEHFQLETLLRKTIASQEMKIEQLTTENQKVNEEYILEKEKVKVFSAKFHQLYKKSHQSKSDSNENKNILSNCTLPTIPASYDTTSSHISSHSEKTHKEKAHSFYLCDTLPSKVFSHQFLQTLQHLPSDLAAQIVSQVSNVLENLLIDEPIFPETSCTSHTNTCSHYPFKPKDDHLFLVKLSENPAALKTMHHDPTFLPHHTNVSFDEEKQGQTNYQRESYSYRIYPPRSSSVQPSHQRPHTYDKKTPSSHLSTSDLKHYLMQMKKMTKAPSKHLKSSTCRFSFGNNNSSSHLQPSALPKNPLHLERTSTFRHSNFEKTVEPIRLSQSAMDPIHTSSHSFSTYFLERSNSLYTPNETCASYQKGNYLLENQK